jgi:hypothetical protein
MLMDPIPSWLGILQLLLGLCLGIKLEKGRWKR